MSSWISHSESIIGTSHSSQGEEKQDSVSVLHDKEGNIAFCLSDGAGSSKYSQLSSAITAQFMTDAFSKIPIKIKNEGTTSWINDYIIQCIINLRIKLHTEFSTDDLSDYHCTLVSGILIGDTCVVAHIGDGAVLCGASIIEQKQNVINNELHLSKPENGEYKNETYFLTEPWWLKHLRIKVIQNVSWLIAGTDGGIDLLSVGDHLNDELVSDFLLNLMNCSPAGREQQLNRVMNSKKADEKTNDDKSLVIITSEELFLNENSVWHNSSDSLKKFHPQPHDTYEVEGQIKATPISSTEIKSKFTEATPKTRSIRSVYKFLRKQTILTILFLLILIFCSYFIFDALMPSTHKDQIVEPTTETNEPLLLQPIPKQEVASEDTNQSIDDKSKGEEPIGLDNETPDQLTGDETKQADTIEPELEPTEPLLNPRLLEPLEKPLVILEDPLGKKESGSLNDVQAHQGVEAGGGEGESNITEINQPELSSEASDDKQQDSKR